MAGNNGATPRQREILFEFTRIGSTVRVSAVDSETNVEVTVVGAAGATRDALMRLAERKLAYVLDKRRSR